MSFRFALTLSVALFFSISAHSQSNSNSYDVDAQIIGRPSNVKIPKAPKESGYCCLVFDVSKTGIAQNIETTYCTHDALSKPSKERVANLLFTPAIRNNQKVVRKNKTHRFGRLLMQKGGARVILGPNGYLARKNHLKHFPHRQRGLQTLNG